MMISSSLPLSERPQAVCRFLKDLDGFILIRGDEYLGEYVAPYAERLAWVTGFTGSAGFALILKNGKNCVFSDGRYSAQLEEQVPSSLWQRAHSGLLKPQDYLASLERPQGEKFKIGYDPHLISPSHLKSWQAPHIEFIAVEENPIDAAWEEQPAPPEGAIMPHLLNDAGEECASKRERCAKILRDAGEKAFILTDCSSIMWLLNIRGNDIPMTPLAHGYAILYDTGDVDYFVKTERLGKLSLRGLYPQDPSLLEEKLKELGAYKVSCDPAITPLYFIETLKKYGAEVAFRADPCALPKAIKNKREQEGNKKAHFLDGLALIRFLSWFEKNGIGKYETEISEKLEAFRAVSPDYRGPSFETISAFGKNGAYPHYRAEKGKDAKIEEDNLYLVDSGAQYIFGTTDITRTLWTGKKQPPKKIKDHYTRVLKGNIALSQMRFPKGVAGYRLDVIARASLWQAGLDYDHGTGHGIGSYLSVHEGPQSISPAARQIPLEAGMILSNEPGFYALGEYGIRIENLLLVKDAPLKGFQNRPFLEFEVLSYTPIDKSLIERELLSEEEKNWLNHYHQEVLKKFLPHLEEEYHGWLEEKCASL